MSQVCCNEPITETDIIINSNKTQTLRLLLPQGAPQLPELAPPWQGEAGSLTWSLSCTDEGGPSHPAAPYSLWSKEPYIIVILECSFYRRRPFPNSFWERSSCAEPGEWEFSVSLCGPDL